MFKPDEIEGFSMALDSQMTKLEERIMSDIVRRIRINGEITRSADWQLSRLRQLGMSRQEIADALKDSLGYTDEQMRQLYSAAVESGYARDEELYIATGKEFVPFEENAELQQLISAVAVQTNEELQNITQSLGFAQRGLDGKLHFTGLADYYQQTLDTAMFDISSGAFDYNTVLKRVIKEMTNSGLRTVDYATGHSNRVTVAARRALMTGMAQLTAKVNEDNAAALETDTYEISWHTGARPSHWWGGRWYKKDELVSICGLGDVTGLCGANCYHDYYPVVPGVSEPTYTDEELAEMNRRENEKIAFGGKEYNKYEATQRQRQLETTMRAQREQIKLLKEGGADEDDIIAARARYRATSAEYSRFSSAMGIPQQRDRVTMDGLGNVGQGKFTPKPEVNNKSIDKSAKSSIIKNIKLDNVTTAVQGGKINEDVAQTIFDTLKETNSQNLFDDVAVINTDPKVVMQTDPVRKGTFFDTKLNLNESFLGGKTVEQIDKELSGTDYTVANSLQEATKHEIYHAKLISGLNQAKLEALYDELSEVHIDGISPTAWKDGAECIAETGVLFDRGETESIPQEAKKLFNKYIGGLE
jgi:hypothetical protein